MGAAGKVLAALCVVAALCGCATTRERVRTANLNIGDLHIALAVYYSDTGGYPREAEGLAVLLRPAAPGMSPYITRIPADPWGHPYRYRLIDNSPQIDSAGPDGVFGTADDVRE